MSVSHEGLKIENCTFKSRFDVKSNKSYVNFTSRTIFEGPVSFEDTEFHQNPDLSDCEFHSDVSFKNATFLKRANFGTVTFPARVDLSNTYFEEPTTFHEVTFAGAYPILDGALLHAKTDFTASPSHWPTSVAHEDAQSAAKSCSIIRQNVTAQGLVEDGHFFYRCEMRARRMQANLFETLFFWIFWATSNYGHSILRPLVSLMFVVGVGGFIFWDPCSRDWYEAFGLSFANTFKFLGFHRSFWTTSPFQDMAHNLLLLSAGQMIAGIVLTFVLGLGLRNRFRLK